MKIVAPKEVGRPLGEGEAVERSSVVPAKAPEVSQTSRVSQTSQAPSPVPSPAQVRAQAGAAVQSARQAASQPVSKPVSQSAPAPAAAVQAAAPAAPKAQAAPQPVSQPVSQSAPAGEAYKASSQDYFAKYDDPEYISRRLAELRRERAQQEGKGQ